MRSAVFYTTLALFIILSSPGSGETPAETGLEGVITIGPVRPGPIKVDTPPSQPLPDTAFEAQSETGVVTDFTTDSQGRFRVALLPGHYVISKKGPKSSAGYFGPFNADVVAGKMTHLELQCDSGMR